MDSLGHASLENALVRVNSIALQYLLRDEGMNGENAFVLDGLRWGWCRADKDPRNNAAGREG
jgi:hypothetical protein